MSDTNILILAGLSAMSTLLGVFLGKLFKKTKNNITFSIGFAGSIMLLISIFGLIPKAAEDLSLAKLFFWILMGSLIIWLADLVIPHLHSISAIKNKENQNLTKVSYLITLGIVLHNFPEGFAIPSSFGYSDSLGLLVIASIFIHNLPEGYILTIAPLKSNNQNFYYKSALLSMLATFMGAVFGIKLISNFHNLNAVFLSLAAGAMIYMSLHELFPEGLKYKNTKIFLLGIGGAMAVYFVFGLL